MDKAHAKSDKSGIQVIARAAAILRVLKTRSTGMSLGEIAKETHLARSTVQRIVGALQSEQLVTSNQNGRSIRLGPALADLAAGAHQNIVETCRPILADLARTTGETADLSVLRGASMVFLDQVPGTQRLRAVSSVGEVFPLTTTANGKACLSRLPRERALALARSEWSQGASSPDTGRFSAELDRIAETGLAYDLGSHSAGICAIGIAFVDPHGDLNAISVPVPESRFEGVQPKVEIALREMSNSIEQVIAGA